ncbi:MFS transporter [Leucobacter rhizosphaerae]|uniref:MFS transporter n=1 Tax=Leucobacter rhizosphaerae TaxID=2932245 RepID=A0ABY4FSG2_9MICO|nr:MFS transporter [Leucobacter rhizosphaerae]
MSEFVVMGLLPQIAADLEPELVATAPDAALALTGGLVWGYALGVVVGMVVTPLLLRRLSERRILLVCGAAMLVGTALTAMSPNLTVAILLRFAAALTHASYVGIASSLVGRLLGTTHQGRGAAIVVGGLSIANLLGVPVLTALGSGGNWRTVLVACAVLFAAPVGALWCLRPPEAHPRSGSPSAGRGGPGGRRIWVLAAVVTVIASGCFAVTTFVAPLADRAQGIDGPVPISVLMLLFGIGMNLGNVGGGWSADRSAEATVLLSGAIGIVGAAAVLIPAASGATIGFGVCAIGLSLGLLTPGAQVLYVRTAGGESRLAASLAPGTINLGSFLGAVVGGAGLALAGPAAVGVLAVACIGGATALQMLRVLQDRGARTRAVRSPIR